ncbi:MAG TPA: CdaR family protein [Bacillota bacterium]
MERLLRKNSTARVLSVVLAVVLWFYVVSEQNPTVAKTFRIPLEVRSLDPMLAVVSIDPEAVSVVVEGPGQVVNALTPEDFTATINLADAAPGPVVATVHVTAPNATQLVEVEPSQVISLVEPVVEARVPVELAVTGRVAPDFRAEEPEIIPPEVVVRGGSSLVARVERVVTNIDVGGARSTVQQQLALYAIDASGRQVPDVQIVPRHVTVTVPVRPLPPLALLPIQVRLEGQPANGYEVAAPAVSRPGYAVVRAESAVLAEITHVTTKPVDIRGARAPVEQSVELELPDGIELVGPERVHVYVPIRRAP